MNKEENKPIFKLGGICSILAGVFYLTGMVLSNIIGGVPVGWGYVDNLTKHLTVAEINFVLFSVCDFMFIPVMFAFYFLLRKINRTAMLVAFVFVGSFAVLDLAITELNSFIIVFFLQNHSVVRDISYPLATLPIGTFLSFFVSSVGFLIVAIVSLRSGFFNKKVAYLGIASLIEGIIGSFYVFIPILGLFLTPCLIAFGVWLILVGIKFLRLKEST